MPEAISFNFSMHFLSISVRQLFLLAKELDMCIISFGIMITIVLCSTSFLLQTEQFLSITSDNLKHLNATTSIA